MSFRVIWENPSDRVNIPLSRRARHVGETSVLPERRSRRKVRFLVQSLDSSSYDRREAPRGPAPSVHAVRPRPSVHVRPSAGAVTIPCEETQKAFQQCSRLHCVILLVVIIAQLSLHNKQIPRCAITIISLTFSQVIFVPK